MPIQSRPTHITKTAYHTILPDCELRDSVYRLTVRDGVVTDISPRGDVLTLLAFLSRMRKTSLPLTFEAGLRRYGVRFRDVAAQAAIDCMASDDVYVSDFTHPWNVYSPYDAPKKEIARKYPNLSRGLVQRVNDMVKPMNIMDKFMEDEAFLRATYARHLYRCGSFKMFVACHDRLVRLTKSVYRERYMAEFKTLFEYYTRTK